MEGEWAESGDTAEGRRAHGRVDEGGGRLPEPDELGEESARARAVTLSSERLGVIAKMDVVETGDGMAMPYLTPRLAYLEWVEGEWAESGDTAEGRRAHGRVDEGGGRLMVETEEETVEVPLIDVSQVSLFGPVSVTTPALHALMRAEIPVSWFSTGGWFLGHTRDRPWQRSTTGPPSQAPAVRPPIR